MEINLKGCEPIAVSDNIKAGLNGYDNAGTVSSDGDAVNFSNAALSCEERGDYAGAAQLFYRAFLAGGRLDYSMLERTVKNLIDGGKIQHAGKFVGMLRGRIADGVYNELLSELSMAGYKTAASEIEGGGGSEFCDGIDDGFLNKFLELFSGREGIYALQYVDAGGRAGYRPVREALDAEVLRSHLNGELTVGIYPVRVDNGVRFMAFDIDVSKHFITSSNGVEIDGKLREACALTLQIVSRLASLSVRPLVEFSGNKGYHVWVFFEKPVQAAVAIKFAEIVLAKIDLSVYEHIGVEIFPKQSRVGDGGIGNLIKLPLGVHLKTGRRCHLLDAKTMEPLDDSRKAVMEADFVPEKLISAVEGYLRERAEKVKETAVGAAGGGAAAEGCENRKYSVTIQPLCKRLDKKTVDVKPKREKVTAVQFELFNNTNIAEITDGLSGAVKKMIDKCKVLSFLVKKARHEKYLTHDERLVILYTVGFAGEGGAAAIHRIISECCDYKKEITESFIRSRRENCMGCYRIRQRLSEIAKFSGCGCSFNLSDRQSYASPLVHINMEFKRVSVVNEEKAAALRASGLVEEAAMSSPPAPGGVAGNENASGRGVIVNGTGGADNTVHISTIERIAADYLKYKKQYIELLELLKKSKDGLLYLMRSEKIDRIEIKEGVVCLIDDNGHEKMVTSFASGNIVKA